MSVSKAASSSYRPKGYGMSASLLRARRPFFLRNMITGVAIASFGVGVWAYSISAVKQDVFDDVDEQARVLNASSIDPLPTLPETFPTNVAAGRVSEETQDSTPPVLETKASKGPRGVVFATLGGRFPWLFEPIHKTLVWGAPSVDQVGELNEKTLDQRKK